MIEVNSLVIPVSSMKPAYGISGYLSVLIEIQFLCKGIMYVALWNSIDASECFVHRLTIVRTDIV